MIKLLLLLCILTTTLGADYSFVTTYAPKIWMAQGEEYFPCSVEYYQNYTHVEAISGVNWLISNEKLSDPSQVLPYFHGQNPNSTIVPVYTIVLPDPREPDPVLALEQPLTHRVIVTYFTLYPYNRGKEILDTVFDDHIGDLEHAHIYFTNGKPTTVVASYHAWNTTKKWGDPGIEMVGNHPVLYSAWGGHGLWFSAGAHEYYKFPKLVDYTSQGTAWDTWKDLDIIFPWAWNKTYSSAWNTTWLTEIFRWGDPSSDFPKDNCFKVFGDTYCRLEDGPVGFLGKSLIQDIIRGLVAKGISCKENCLWPAGIFS